MKKNLPVTDHERTFSPDQRLISLTNKKGIITHVNAAFVEISGFSSDELIKKNHNLVRHPDMPPAAFEDLWESLKAGKPWMGIVKNRCKNGDYYWVDAYVAPVFEDGSIVGYQSVRTTPDQEHVGRANRIYKRLRMGKRPSPLPFALSVRQKLFAAMTIMLALPLVHSVLSGAMGLPVAIGDLVAGTLIAWVVASMLTAPMRKLAADSRKIFDNPLMGQIYAGSRDEVGQTRLALAALQAKLRTVVGRIEDSVEELGALAEQTAQSVQQTRQGCQKQQSDSEQFAAAMTEMAASVQEVAQSTSEAAQAAQAAEHKTTDGRQVVTQSTETMESVAEEFDRVAQAVAELDAKSGQIGTVLDVIREVAEQTNLLALNAAIEAARAGEQGRGFAVVAEEVRSLAQRTQASTQEIQDMVGGLQDSSSKVVQAMGQGRDQVRAGVAQSEKANEALEAIKTAVSTINDMSAQIASAAEQQSAVAEEINRSITNINDVSRETANIADSTARNSDDLAQLAGQFQSLVHQARL